VALSLRRCRKEVVSCVMRSWKGEEKEKKTRIPILDYTRSVRSAKPCCIRRSYKLQLTKTTSGGSLGGGPLTLCAFVCEEWMHLWRTEELC
jgi:hypothetical protein